MKVFFGRLKTIGFTNVTRFCFPYTYRNYDIKCVRVRFAPSPTGYLHVGGLRTALYNYFFAKVNNGKLILRIEDTDQTRLIEGAADRLQEDLNWCGIEINEGPNQGGAYGPYTQSQRMGIYRKHADILLKNGSAYHCFCTDRRLQLLKCEAMKAQEIPKYDNRCRHLSETEVQNKLNSGETSCIRFKISDTTETFDDLIYGKISYNVSLNEGDPVIIKSDGYPTYHFANIVDDHLMDVSHVLRGAEWQISTTKHILLYRAFGWQPPLFGHLPLLMNADGSKLSKRQGNIDISYYREKHIFPLALVNFIVQSGGGFTKDLVRNIKPRCFTMEQLANQFDLSHINSHSGKLMPERLLEFNRLELKRRLQDGESENALIQEIKQLLNKSFPQRISDNSLMSDDHYIKSILHWTANRISKLSDLVSKDLEFVWIMPRNFSNIDKLEASVVEALKNKLETEEHLGKEHLNLIFKEFCKKHGVKFSHLMKTLRAILSGLKEGPSVAEMIEILGKKNTVDRLGLFINHTRNRK